MTQPGQPTTQERKRPDAAAAAAIVAAGTPHGTANGPGTPP